MVTLKMSDGEARLLVQAIMDRQIMLAADHHEGRMTNYEFNDRMNALRDLEERVKKLVPR